VDVGGLSAEMTTYVVELMVFSGATNPRFVLTVDEAAELRRLITAPTELAAVRRPPRLGYQGLLVYAQGPNGAWHPWLSVSDGVARVVQGPGTGRSYRADALEQHLLQAARGHGLGDVLEQANPPSE
jgi:hypothetical protein